MKNRLQHLLAFGHRLNLRLLLGGLGVALLLAAGALLVTTYRPLSGFSGTRPELSAETAVPVRLPGHDRGRRHPAGKAGPLALDDFQITVPAEWVRKGEWEDEGPGTKLFLVGPEVAQVRLVIGVDVYPLRTGTTLEAFVQDYSTRWAGQNLVQKKATLCDQPARLVVLAEGDLEKTFLLTSWRDKGFVIGMVAPNGQRQKALPEFRRVLDSFQVYQ